MIKVCFFLLLFLQILFAENLVVVAERHSDISALSTEQVRMIFLKKRRFWKTLKLHPLNLPPTEPLRQDFEKKVLHLSQGKLDAYWTKEHYLGVRPPYTLGSVNSTILYVKKVKGAIGYIPESKVDGGLKILYRVEK